MIIQLVGAGTVLYLDYESRKNIVENNTATKNDIDINNADGLSLKFNQNEFLSNKCSVSNPIGYCNAQATGPGTANTIPNSAYQDKNCPPLSLVLCEGEGPRCPNGYHRSPDGDCERFRD
jgi:hypothetical protein